MGVEFSIRYQINDHWGFYGSYAYTDIELTKDAPNSVGVRFGLPADAFKGDRLPGTPQNQGAFNVNYNRDIFQQMFLQLDYGLSSISNVYTKTGLRGSGEILPGFTLHSAFITLGTDVWSAQLFTKNMFNKFATTGVRRDSDYIDKRADGNGIYAPPGEAFTLRQYHHNVIQPRTIGVDFRYNFDFGS